MMALSDLHDSRPSQSTPQGWFEASSSGYAGPSQPDFHSIPIGGGFAPPPPPSTSFMDGLTNQMRDHAIQFVTQEAVHQAKQKATGLGRYLSIEWLVSIFQPFFIVDGSAVFNRMKNSFIPIPQDFSQSQPDLYGPLMINLTLALFLIMCMKVREVQLTVEGTAIGSSLAVCFGYWIGASACSLVATCVTDTQLGIPNILCATGYAMSSFLIALSLAYAAQSSKLFIFLFLTACLCSAISLGRTYKDLTPDPRRGLAIAAFTAVIHLLFLVYLRASYLHLS
jgi:hypothetical protein